MRRKKAFRAVPKRWIPMAELHNHRSDGDAAQFDAGARAVYDLVMREAAANGYSVSLGFLNGVFTGSVSALLTLVGHEAAIATIATLGKQIEGSGR